MNRHDLIDELLMRYAAGHLSPVQAAMVAAHMRLNPRARQKISYYEAVGGSLICEEQPASVSAQCLSVVLQRIESPKPAPPQSQARERRHALPLPEEICCILDCVCEDQPMAWTQVMKGFVKMDLHARAQQSEGQLYLMKLEPFERVPRHAHYGLEMTLVLKGGFSDDSGIYRPGDIAIVADPRVVHAPEAGEYGCLCLVLAEKPLRFEDPVQRFFRQLFGR